jgi:hypothetical protein
LTGATPEEVDTVLAEVSELEPLARHLRSQHRAAGRATYAQFRAPFELYAFVRLLSPRHVVETGVSSGVSSAFFLAGLRRNGSGSLHSVDLPTRQRGPRFGPRDSPVALPPGRKTGWALPEDLKEGWDLRIGPSQKVLPALVNEVEEVNIFLHDSHHTPTHLRFELTTVEPKLRPGSIVLADNTMWTGQAFPWFARRLRSPMRRRGRGDLVGLRVP